MHVEWIIGTWNKWDTEQNPNRTKSCRGDHVMNEAYKKSNQREVELKMTNFPNQRADGNVGLTS